MAEQKRRCCPIAQARPAGLARSLTTNNASHLERPSPRTWNGILRPFLEELHPAQPLKQRNNPFRSHHRLVSTRDTSPAPFLILERNGTQAACNIWLLAEFCSEICRHVIGPARHHPLPTLALRLLPSAQHQRRKQLWGESLKPARCDDNTRCLLTPHPKLTVRIPATRPTSHRHHSTMLLHNLSEHEAVTSCTTNLAILIHDLTPKLEQRL